MRELSRAAELAPGDPRTAYVFGVALSGGGSRAALFGAAGLEALARLRTPSGSSVLEEVGYVSAVSGGSLPPTYLCLHNPARAIPVLTPNGSLTQEYREFCGRLRSAIGSYWPAPRPRWWRPGERAR